MKKTFELLAQLDKADIEKIKITGKIPINIKNFLRQLSKDFEQYIAQGSYEINLRADNWNKYTSALDDDNPYMSQDALEKINLLYRILDTPKRSEKDHLDAAILVDMSQSLETVLLQRGIIEVVIATQDEDTFIIQNIIEEYRDFLIKKLQYDGFKIKGMQVTILNTTTLSLKQEQLIERYKIIQKLYKRIEGKKCLNETDPAALSTAFNKCMEHQDDDPEEKEFYLSLFQPVKNFLTRNHDFEEPTPIKSARVIQNTVSDYLDHLQEKLEKEGFNITPNGTIISHNASDNLTSTQKKLFIRYEALVALQANIKDKFCFGKAEIDDTQVTLEICLNNQPDWLERPFLQKLTDILSLGFKPLYRTFFSKEKEVRYQVEIEKVIPKPEM